MSVLKSGLSFVVVDNSNGTEHPVRLNNIYARHNVSAALRAFAAARCEVLPYSLIVKGLAEYHTTGVRQNVIWTEDGICLYADCYNAIATSVRSAVETSDIIPVTGKRIAVLGDIEEWDSLSVVSFIAMAKAVCGKMVERQSIVNAKTVSDLFKLVK